jgi:ABC-type dipeptide/oligopeptide/nickel transport system permease subunit
VRLPENLHVYQKRIKDFWLEYRQSKLGILGVILLIIYLFTVVFGPSLVGDPSARVAEKYAMPLWATILPQYRDLPQTAEKQVNWTLTQPSDFVGAEFASYDSELCEMLNTSEISEWEIQYRGGSTKDLEVWLGWNFTYQYASPRSFTINFRWRATNLTDMGYCLELFLVRWDNGTTKYSLWDSNTQIPSRMARSTDYKYTYSYGRWPRAVSLPSDFQSIYVDRFGLDPADNLAKIIFSEKGEYGLMIDIRLRPKSLGATCNIDVINTKFTIPGLVFGIFGTDNSGADVFAQLVYGSRISLAIGLIAAIITTTLGLAVGVFSGYRGGYVDEFLMRIVDILLCLPLLPLLLILVFIFGRNLFLIILFITLLSWMSLARVIRSQVLSIREMPFIESAKASGAKVWYILVRHIIPNVLPVAFITMIVTIPGAILLEAALSFLGWGDPTLVTWGRMLNYAMRFEGFSRLAWWWFLPPGIAMLLVCAAFIFVSNALDQVVNPRLRRRR